MTRAILYGAAAPDAAQRARFEAFLKRRYGEDAELVFEKSPLYPNGFRLEVGAEIYDWSVEGRLRQLKDLFTQAPDVDGKIFFPASGRKPRFGEFRKVKITDCMDCDLIGEIVG